MTTPGNQDNRHPQGAAGDVIDTIQGIPGILADAYPRDAHRGRLEQIGQVCATLQSLVAQLPDEEQREADYTQRVVDMHGAGLIDPSPLPPGAPMDGQNPEVARRSHPQSAFERLAEAQRNGG